MVEIRNKRFAGRVLAQIERNMHALSLAASQLHHVLDAHLFFLAVWHFNAYRMLARQRGDHPDGPGGQRASDIIGKRGYLADFDTGGKLKFEHCHNRPGIGGHHFGIDIELRQQRLQIGRL